MRIAYAAGPTAAVAAVAPVRSQPRSTRGGNARGRGGRGGRGGRRSEGQPKKSQEELDAEMDNYMQAPPVSIFMLEQCQMNDG
jgi:C-terminal duplication domain of Friend of PRMT1